MKPLTLGNVTLALPLQHGAAIIVDDNGANVAVCLGDIDTSENVARLFAASPDLLLAAEELLHRLDVYEDMVTPFHDTDGERMYAAKIGLYTAIARARGKES